MAEGRYQLMRMQAALVEARSARDAAQVARDRAIAEAARLRRRLAELEELIAKLREERDHWRDAVFVSREAITEELLDTDEITQPLGLAGREDGHG